MWVDVAATLAALSLTCAGLAAFAATLTHGPDTHDHHHRHRGGPK